MVYWIEMVITTVVCSAAEWSRKYEYINDKSNSHFVFKYISSLSFFKQQSFASSTLILRFLFNVIKDQLYFYLTCFSCYDLWLCLKKGGILYEFLLNLTQVTFELNIQSFVTIHKDVRRVSLKVGTIRLLTNALTLCKHSCYCGPIIWSRCLIFLYLHAPAIFFQFKWCLIFKKSTSDMSLSCKSSIYP